MGQGDDQPSDETLDQGTDPENSGILAGYAESNNDDSDSPMDRENQAGCLPAPSPTEAS